MAINGIDPSRLVPGLIEKLSGQSSGVSNVAPDNSPSFADMLGNLLESVNDIHNESGAAQKAFVAGEPIELHELMIKNEQAGVATDLLLEIRNRLLTAYNDILRMPM